MSAFAAHQCGPLLRIKGIGASAVSVLTLGDEYTHHQPQHQAQKCKVHRDLSLHWANKPSAMDGADTCMRRCRQAGNE